MNLRSSLVGKLLLMVTGIAVVGFGVMYRVSVQHFRELTDRQQSAVYDERVETVLAVLQRSYDRLQLTAREAAYRDDFQDSVLRTLHDTYYQRPGGPALPVLFDREGRALLDPTLPRGALHPAGEGWVSQALRVRQGEFTVAAGEDGATWVAVGTFAPWGWTVAYRVPHRLKYAALHAFQRQFLFIVLLTGAALIGALGVVQARAMGPILKLARASQAMAVGAPDDAIPTDRGDEIGVLARSFEQMRQAIRDQIGTLRAEVENRQQAEATARDAERRFRGLVESTAAAHWELELPSQRCTYVSPQLVAMLGYPAETWHGLESWSERIHPQDRDAALAQLRRAAEAVESCELQFRALHAGGTVRWLHATLSPPEGGAAPRKLVGFLLDITAQRAAEADRARLEDQLRQSQKMEAVGTLAGGIAHDFNNILQAISGTAQLLLETPAQGERLRTQLERIDLAATRAAELVRRLLTFSRHQQPKIHPLNLNAQIHQALALLERTIPPMIAIDTHLADDLLPVQGDATQVEQVLMNLGTNARDAMPDGGRLVIETANVELTPEYCAEHLEAAPGRYALLCVSDTGCGMDRETLSRVFEPFFTTKGVGEGTGLGLSTVYGIVKGHGGHLTCYSEPGGGTVFRIYLPAVAAPRPAGPEPEAPAPVAGGSETVLLADDDEGVLEVGRSALESAGYRVLTATSGEDVLELYRRDGAGIDLVLLDLGMPGMGGERCLEELVRLDPGAAVVIASGYSQAARGQALAESGARAFLSKPVRIRKLLACVRRVLDEDAAG